ERFGADATRMYVLFAAPPEKDFDWQDHGVEGIHRFLARVWRLATAPAPSAHPGPTDQKLLRKVHQTMQRITRDFEGRWHFNTSIAGLMELVNEHYACEGALSPAAAAESIRLLLLMLAPFAPFMAQELWTRRGESGAIALAPWPQADAELAREEALEVVVQVNGKLRARIAVPPGTDAAALEALARSHEKIVPWLAGKTPRQVIAVPGRLVNFVLP
ncbi:MAG: class I tRNA ligase family protein, partial [Terriglobales bacterium]